MAASSHGKHRNHTETRKIKKNRLDGTHVVPPVPHTESTEINGIHEKGDWGGLLRRSGLSRASFRRKLVTVGSGNPPLRESRGRSLRVHPRSFFAPLLPPCASPSGAKPSSTPAVVLRPRFVWVCCGKGGAMCSSEPEITVMDSLDVLRFRVWDSF